MFQSSRSFSLSLSFGSLGLLRLQTHSKYIKCSLSTGVDGQEPDGSFSSCSHWSVNSNEQCNRISSQDSGVTEKECSTVPVQYYYCLIQFYTPSTYRNICKPKIYQISGHYLPL